MPGASDLPWRHGQPEPAAEARQSAQPDISDHDDSPVRMAAESPLDLRQRLKGFPDGHPSSPNNADGSPRPPTVDLSKLESAAETDGHAEPAGNPEYAEHPEGGVAARAENPAEHADDSTSEGWRAALPRLRGLWERHTERWPAEQRTPVDRSTDEPGSWRADDGRYLNCEENLVTEHAVDRVGKAEPEVTRTIKVVEAEVPGARLVGLQYCLKGEERYKEKVAAEVRLKPERSIAEILGRVPDAIRYTFECDEDRYVDNYQGICGKLEERGNELLVRRNSWDDLDYKGVNTRWLTTAGQTFEVQIHTADSFQAKQLTHVAYERLRTGVAKAAERPELESFQQAVTSSIPVPRGVDAITDYRKEGY
jgi:hypothetical protein